MRKLTLLKVILFVVAIFIIKTTYAHTILPQSLENSLQGTLNEEATASVTVPSSVNFSSVVVGQTVEQTITLSATNLTGNLSLQLIAIDGGFSMPTTTITKEEAMAGTSFKVTFTSEEAFPYAGLISINGGGLAGAKTITLTGEGVASKASVKAKIRD